MQRKGAENARRQAHRVLVYNSGRAKTLSSKGWAVNQYVLCDFHVFALKFFSLASPIKIET